MPGPSGKTTKHELPYPTPDDNVDYPRDLKALAEKVDVVLGPVPVGAIMMWATGTAPINWLLCLGQQVPASAWPLLAQVLTPVGGQITLPNLQGRVPVGVGSNAEVATVGANDGLAVGDRRPRHQHRHRGMVAQRQSLMVIQNTGGSDGTHPAHPGTRWDLQGPVTSGPSYELPMANNDLLAPTIITSTAEGPAYFVVNFVMRAA